MVQIIRTVKLPFHTTNIDDCRQFSRADQRRPRRRGIARSNKGLRVNAAAEFKTNQTIVLGKLSSGAKNSKEMGSLRRALINVHRILSSDIASSQPAAVFRPQCSFVSRFCSGTSQSVDIDFSDEESKRRLFNRLLYRSKQRGFLELDLVLGKWVEDTIHSMDQDGIKALVHVLDLENPDLWKWLTGQEQPPETVSINPVFSAVKEKVLKNLDSHASPETRATPGQPWVRGWDDFKKGRNAPIAGNQ